MLGQRDAARVAAMMTVHGGALQRVARRYSATADDAEDAVQRGLEIYLRRLARVDPATEVAWLKVVVKHEAMALRRARADAPAGDAVDFDAHPAPDQRSLEDLLAGRERAGRVAEALRRLKPDEARALLLQADGLSYGEIGAELAWSYTKVNRCLTEGRKRFLELYAEIEAGAECERFAPALAALARGRAGAETLLELRPHLRHCSACRATVRHMHIGRRARLAVLAPLPWLHGLALRLMGADAAAGAQLAVAAGGGGRVATLGAVAGLCLGGVGPAAACLPFAGEEEAAKPARVVVAARPAVVRAAATTTTSSARPTSPRAIAATRMAPASQPAPGPRREPAPRRGEFAFELAGAAPARASAQAASAGANTALKEDAKRRAARAASASATSFERGTSAEGGASASSPGTSAGGGASSGGAPATPSPATSGGASTSSPATSGGAPTSSPATSGGGGTPEFGFE